MQRSGSGFVCNSARKEDLFNKTSVDGSKDIRCSFFRFTMGRLKKTDVLRASSSSERIL